ncbi:hypothetical protein LguiA_008735 [Lonicera macranthoides]
MDLETENRIAAILMKEAAELRRQADKEGVHVYLRQPNVRGRPNSRFLTATVLGVQQEIASELSGGGFGITWKLRKLANRAEEIKEMWRLRQKEQELDDRLKGRLRDDNSSDRSYRDTSESRRSTSKSLVDREGTDGASRTLSKREIQDLSLREEKGLRDEEIEEFLQSRAKRGRGTVGSRMDETGPYLPLSSDSKGKGLANPNVGSREEWENRVVLGPQKPSTLKLYESSESDSDSDSDSRRDRRKKEKKVSSKQHSRKHRLKKKSKDKKKRKEEKRRKRHK